MNQSDVISKIEEILKGSGLEESETATKIVEVLSRAKDGAASVAVQRGLGYLIDSIKADPKKYLSDAIESVKQVYGQLKSSMGDLFSETFDDEIATNYFKKFQEKARNAMTPHMGGISSSPEDLLKDYAGAGLRTFATGKIKDSSPVQFVDKIEEALSFSLQKYQESTTDLFREKGGISTGTEGRENTMRSLQESAAYRQVNFGESSEQAIAAVTNMMSLIDNLDAQLGKDFKIQIDGKPALSAANALSIFSEELGVSQNSLANYVNFTTTRFDSGAKNLESNLLTIANAAEASRMPVSNFLEDIQGATGDFKELGDVTKVSSEMLAQFAQNLGPNRLGQARDLFKQITSGIAGMNDGMKAFLSMGNGLGGGGGALDSIINLEEAIASGDQGKIKEIQDEAAARVEELTGGQLLTRKEAVDSGQQELFYRQSALMEQMGLTQGRNQFNNFVEAQRGGAATIGNANFTNLADRHLDSEINNKNITDTLANVSYGVAESNTIDSNIFLSRLRKNGLATGMDLAGENGPKALSGAIDNISEYMFPNADASLEGANPQGKIAATIMEAGEFSRDATLGTINSSPAQADIRNSSGAGASLLRKDIETSSALPTAMLDNFAELTDSINTSNAEYIAKIDEQIAALAELASKIYDSKVNINLSPDAMKLFSAMVNKQLVGSLTYNK